MYLFDNISNNQKYPSSPCGTRTASPPDK